MKVVAIIDPILEKAQEVLQKRLKGKQGHIYQGCKVLADVYEYLDSGERPDAIFVGVPPAYHGSSQPGKDLELKILSHGIPVFVEKPQSCEPPEVFAAYAQKVKSLEQKANIGSSIGYNFRSAFLV